MRGTWCGIQLPGTQIVTRWMRSPSCMTIIGQSECTEQSIGQASNSNQKKTVEAFRRNKWPPLSLDKVSLKNSRIIRKLRHTWANMPLLGWPLRHHVNYHTVGRPGLYLLEAIAHGMVPFPTMLSLMKASAAILHKNTQNSQNTLFLWYEDCAKGTTGH